MLGLLQGVDRVGARQSPPPPPLTVASVASTLAGDGEEGRERAEAKVGSPAAKVDITGLLALCPVPVYPHAGRWTLILQWGEVIMGYLHAAL